MYGAPSGLGCSRSISTDFGVLGCLGLLLLDVPSIWSCFLLGETLRDGDTPEFGVRGGDPLTDETLSTFSGVGDVPFLFSFSLSSPKSMTKSRISGDFLTLKSKGAVLSLITSLGLLTDFRTSAGGVLVLEETTCDRG